MGPKKICTRTLASKTHERTTEDMRLVSTEINVKEDEINYKIHRQAHYYYYYYFIHTYKQYGCTRWCSWLRHCATNQKVAGSIPDSIIGIFL